MLTCICVVAVRVLTRLPDVIKATMTSPGSRRTVVVLLVAVVVVNCLQLDAVERLPSPLDQLLEPDTKALVLATRPQYSEHLPTDVKRSWRKNRVRVWGKRTTNDDVDDDDDEDVDKRSWRDNTIRVWGKRQGATTADRRSWAGNTIRVWGKRSSDGLTPEQLLHVAAAARYSAAPKRSMDGSEARLSRLDDGGRLTAEPDVEVGTLAGERHLISTRSKRSPQYGRHGGRWMVRRDVSRRPRWVAFRGPKRSWRTNVIRVWGKRAS